MDLGTILVVLSGMLVVGVLAMQAWRGELGEGRLRGEATLVATRPDLHPLPRGSQRVRVRSGRAA